MRITKKQRANLLEALNVMWPSVPRKNVYPDLGAWRSGAEDGHEPPTCGTVACFGGWCAWWPAFRKQGVSSSFDGAPKMGGDDFVCRVSTRLFGHPYLFASRGAFPSDAGFTGSDHALVSRRLRYVLEHASD